VKFSDDVSSQALMGVKQGRRLWKHDTKWLKAILFDMLIDDLIANKHIPRIPPNGIEPERLEPEAAKIVVEVLEAGNWVEVGKGCIDGDLISELASIRDQELLRRGITLLRNFAFEPMRSIKATKTIIPSTAEKRNSFLR
jgi:hypothetical protein